MLQLQSPAGHLMPAWLTLNSLASLLLHKHALMNEWIACAPNTCTY